MNINVVKELYNIVKDSKPLPNIVTPDKEAIIVSYEPNKIEKLLIKQFGKGAVYVAFQTLVKQNVIGIKGSDHESYIEGWHKKTVYYIRLDLLKKLLSSTS